MIPPVHTAIGILERLTTTGHLFPLRPAWLMGAFRRPRRRPPAPPGTRGSRHRTGLARVLDIETAVTMASYLQHVNDRLDAGEAVSGPAAARLMNAARDAATRYEGMFPSPRQARALLTDPALQVHDNPRAVLACNYDPAKALCHPGRAAGKAASHPALDRCNPACANIARTDEHIEALTAETARLRVEAASPLAPEPVRQRLSSALTRWRPSPSGTPGPVSPRKQTTMDERAEIEAAMDRLLDGIPLRSDGKLTVVPSPPKQASSGTSSPTSTPI